MAAEAAPAVDSPVAAKPASSPKKAAEASPAKATPAAVPTVTEEAKDDGKEGTATDAEILDSRLAVIQIEADVCDFLSKESDLTPFTITEVIVICMEKQGRLPKEVRSAVIEKHDKLLDIKLGGSGNSKKKVCTHLNSLYLSGIRVGI